MITKFMDILEKVTAYS